MASSETKKYYLDSDGVIALLKKLAEFKQNVIESVKDSTNDLIESFKQDVIESLNESMSAEDVNNAYTWLTDDDPETNYDPAMPTA